MKNIAIDGPAGAGKTTISKLLSKELNIMYIDTGAMYRAVAYYFKTKNIDFYNFNLLNELQTINISFDKGDIILNNKNISDFIRTSEISNLSSIYSKEPILREFLTKQQRDLSDNNNVIMEGRDITTVVLPESKCKIYLDASLEERTKRRLKQNNQSESEFESVYNDLKERDYRDSHRDVAPLTIAKDASYIDSTNLNINKVKEIIIEKYNNHLILL